MIKIGGWFKPTSTPVELVIVGRLYSITQHYVPSLRSSAACLSPEHCELCDHAYPIQQLVAIPVERTEGGVIELLRLLPSQRELAQKFAARGSAIVGTLIEVEQSPGHQTSRVMLRITGRRPAHPAPVDAYIKAMGRKAYELIATKLLEQTELPAD